MPKLTETLRTEYYEIYKPLAKVYTTFLEDILFKLYNRPDIAIRCAASSEISKEPPTPEMVISYFYQGLLLIGRNIEGGLIWQSYPRRAIITPETARISKRLKQYIKKENFDIRINEQFEQVVRNCQRTEIKTWINEPVIDLYCKLHEMGYASSLEAYRDGELVGGIWGLGFGRTWSIMSMFHSANRAGSILLSTLVRYLKRGELDLVDCGQMNENFKRYGAHWISVEDFRDAVVQGAYCANDLSGMIGFAGVQSSGRSGGSAATQSVKVSSIPKNQDLKNQDLKNEHLKNHLKNQDQKNQDLKNQENHQRVGG